LAVQYRLSAKAEKLSVSLGPYIGFFGPVAVLGLTINEWLEYVS
jgi:hypothetical protein